LLFVMASSALSSMARQQHVAGLPAVTAASEHKRNFKHAFHVR
jgi:hypothetical protein